METYLNAPKAGISSRRFVNHRSAVMSVSRTWLNKSAQPMIHRLLTIRAVRAFEKKHEAKNANAT
jgi:hypothetical protein